MTYEEMKQKYDMTDRDAAIMFHQQYMGLFEIHNEMLDKYHFLLARLSHHEDIKPFTRTTGKMTPAEVSEET